MQGNSSSLALPSLDLTGGAGELERPSFSTDDLPQAPPFGTGGLPQPSFGTTTLGAVLADEESTALFTQHLVSPPRGLGKEREAGSPPRLPAPAALKAERGSGPRVRTPRAACLLSSWCSPRVSTPRRRTCT